MAITLHDIVQPSGSRTFDSQFRFWRREYTRILQVRTDDPTIGPVGIIEALPYTLGATYAFRNEYDHASYLQSVEVTPDTSATDDFLVWTVQLRYGPIDPSEYPEDPTQQPPEIRGGFVQFEEVCAQDVNGDPILNSANDAFDPPIVRDRSRPVLSISMNLAAGAFDPTMAATYVDTVNESTFMGADAGTVKALPFSYEYLFNPSIGWYWKVLYEFQYNPDGWKKQILDAGLYQIDTDGTTKVPIMVKGIPAQEPQLLDGSGKPLAGASHDTYEGEANYIEAEIYETKDFGALNLKRAEDILMGTGT